MSQTVVVTLPLIGYYYFYFQLPPQETLQMNVCGWQKVLRQPTNVSHFRTFYKYILQHILEEYSIL